MRRWSARWDLTPPGCRCRRTTARSTATAPTYSAVNARPGCEHRSPQIPRTDPRQQDRRPQKFTAPDDRVPPTGRRCAGHCRAGAGERAAAAGTGLLRCGVAHRVGSVLIIFSVDDQRRRPGDQAQGNIIGPGTGQRPVHRDPDTPSHGRQRIEVVAQGQELGERTS